MPAWDPVFALNCFTKSMMFTPWGPSAVPTGGAGVACPAGTCSLTIAVTGLAIGSSISVRSRGLPRIPWSVSLQLQIIQLHGRRTPEQRDRHPDFSLVRQHFLHRPAEIRERPFCDLHLCLRGDQGLSDRLLRVGPRILGNAACDQVAHLVLMPGGRLNRVPAQLRGGHQNILATSETNSH